MNERLSLGKTGMHVRLKSRGAPTLRIIRDGTLLPYMNRSQRKLVSAVHIAKNTLVADIAIEAVVNATEWQSRKQSGAFSVYGGTDCYGIMGDVSVEHFGRIINNPRKGLAPNCSLRWQRRSKLATVWTTKAVAPQEELTFSYRDAEFSRQCRVEEEVARAAAASTAPSSPWRKCENCGRSFQNVSLGRHRNFCE